MRTYYVYLMASDSVTLYVGVTNDLVRRIQEHKQGVVPGFTSRYGIRKLLYYEETGDAREAIAREKQTKSWRREKKLELFREYNPGWRDLSLDW